MLLIHYKKKIGHQKSQVYQILKKT